VLLVFIIVLMASALFISGSRGGIIAFVFSFGLLFLLLGTQKLHGKKESWRWASPAWFLFSSSGSASAR
jgi:hypothetical protein